MFNVDASLLLNCVVICNKKITFAAETRVVPDLSYGKYGKGDHRLHGVVAQ